MATELFDIGKLKSLREDLPKRGSTVNQIIRPNQSVVPTQSAVRRYAPVLNNIVPHAENTAHLAALATRFEASFVSLVGQTGVQLVGSHGLGLQRFPMPIAQIPAWLLPAQARMLRETPELEAIANYLGQFDVHNALGVSVITVHGVIGAIWLLNSLETVQSSSLELLNTFAAQIAFGLEQEVERLEYEKPHKIARERDFALSVAQFLPIGTIVADLAGNIQFMNRAFTKQFGYQLEDTKNRRFHEFVVPEFQAELVAALTNRAEGESSMARYQVYRKDKSVADVEIMGHPRFDSLGRVIGTVATIRDIGEELALERATLEARRAINKKMTETLVETKRSLEREQVFALEIMESLQDGFALLNTEGLFEYVNPAFAQICGFSPIALVGFDARVFVHPEDMKSVLENLAQIKPNQVLSFGHRIIRPDQTIVHVKAHCSLRLDAQGEILGALLCSRDITQKLADETRMLHLESELSQIEEKLQANAGFSGRLETIGGAVGLMQMLAVSPVSGAVQLDDSILFLEHGRIVAVVHPKLTGREAAEAVVQRQIGQFQFIPHVRPANMVLNLDPTQLALAYLAKQDEAGAPQKISSEHQISLPNSKAANAFMQGVGGQEHFRVSLEQNRVILRGRNLKIVVLEANLADFSEHPSPL